jgi:hypothetical protein
MTIQLHGEIKLAPVGDSLVDYSDVISTLMINTKRATVDDPPTYGRPTTEKALGAPEDQVTLVFRYEESNTSGLWAVLYDVMRNGDGEIKFSALFQDGAIGASNRGFTGVFMVADLDTGAPVNAFRQQSKTFPAKDILGPLSAWS